MMSSALRFRGRFIAFAFSVVMLFCVQTALFAAGPAPQAPQGPHIYVQDTQAVKVSHSGDADAVQALVAGQAQPLSSASADLDEDGVADLLVGYSTPTSGVVVLHRGDLDAFAPQSQASFLAIPRGDLPSPFLPNAQAFNLPVRPHFLATGHSTC